MAGLKRINSIFCVLVLSLALGCSGAGGGSDESSVLSMGGYDFEVRPAQNFEGENPEFVLVIKRTDDSEADVWEHAVPVKGMSPMEYFSFSFEHDIKLIDKNGKAHSGLCHFERSRDIKKEKVFFLSFTDIESEASVLELYPRPLGTGLLRIKLDFI